MSAIETSPQRLFPSPAFPLDQLSVALEFQGAMTCLHFWKKELLQEEQSGERDSSHFLVFSPSKFFAHLVLFH